LLFLSAVPAAAGPRDPVPYEWDEVFNPGRALALAQRYQELAKDSPKDIALREKAAMMFFMTWESEKKDLKRRHDLAKLVIRYGKEMIAIDPNRVEGWAWYGLGIEIWGLSRGILNSLQLIPEGKKAFDRALALDPGYLNGTVQACIGRAYMEVPGFPLSIGDAKTAALLTAEGVKRGPENALAKLYLADLYGSVGRNEEALAEARGVAALKPTTDIERELQTMLRPKAAELERKIKAGEVRTKYFDWIWMDVVPGLVD
jgi:tetratricopeptide (TPR) repeat protein